MATAVKDKATPAEASIFDNMTEETSVTLPSRGRGVGEDVLRIRQELVKMLSDRTARSFSNVTTKEQQEALARKVRAAGRITNDEHGEAIKTSNRFDQVNGKLVWGPKEVLDELAKAGKAS